MTRDKPLTTPISCRDIFVSTSNGVIATDKAGRIVHINPNAEKILNLIAAKAMGTPILKSLPLTGRLVSDCLNTGRPQLGRHIHGRNVNLVVNVTPIFKQGELAGTVSNFQHLQQFEDSARGLASYRRLNRQLSAIFQYSSDIIWLYDGEGRVININRAAEKANRIQAQDVIGKHYTELIAMQILERSVVPEVIKTQRQVSIVSNWEGASVGLITGTPVFDDDGHIDFIVANARDMTQLNRIKAALERERLAAERFKDELTELSLFDLKRQQIVAESKSMRRVLQLAMKLSHMEAANILILGESGTGKGLLAKFIHKNSRRPKAPFIQINCAALPENLLEAELFGYEKGAFTGAREQGKIGLLELAHGGTLFLDEIGDLPLPLQAKLLKYLDDHEILRLGGVRPRTVDCRIIAATNQELDTQVKKRLFRKDLFYRLNTFTLQIPPLRRRPDDIFGLIHHYLTEFNRRYQRSCHLSLTAIKELQRYPFPGNVRELKNLLQMAVVMTDTDSLDEALSSKVSGPSPCPSDASESAASAGGLNEEVAAFEKQRLLHALTKCRSTREMAGHLNIHQSTVVRKLQKYGLSQRLKDRPPLGSTASHKCYP